MSEAGAREGPYGEELGPLGGEVCITAGAHQRRRNAANATHLMRARASESCFCTRGSALSIRSRMYFLISFLSPSLTSASRRYGSVRREMQRPDVRGSERTQRRRMKFLKVMAAP